jgi:hypothetical protein
LLLLLLPPLLLLQQLTFSGGLREVQWATRLWRFLSLAATCLPDLHCCFCCFAL